MDRWISFALIIGLCHLVWAVPQKDSNSLSKSNSIDPTKAKIMKQINKVNDDGSYTFGFENDDGSFRVETRSKDGVVKGKYGFLDPSGQLKVTEYTAGEKAQNTEGDVEYPDFQEQNRVRPTQSASDQSTSAQTPISNKIAARAPPRQKNNSYEDEIDVDDGPQQYKYSTGGGPSPTPTADPAEDEEFRSFGNAAQQAYQTRRQAEPSQRDRESQTDQAPRAGPNQYSGQPQAQSRQFGGEQPRYVPTNDFNEQSFGPQGVHQFNAGPGAQFNSLGGQSPQFGGSPQGLGGQSFGGGPQQFSTPVLRSPQQSFGAGPQSGFGGPSQGFGGPQQQYDGISQSPQSFGRPSPSPPSFRGAPQDFSSVGGGRFEEPQQRLSFGAGGGAGPSPYSGFGAGAPAAGRQFGQGPSPNAREQYVPNYELDGFSEDADQDGFVDTGPGQGKAAQAAEKQGIVKTPEGEKIGTTSGDYSPQPLGPQGVLQGGGRPQIRPGQGDISPFLPQSQQLSPEQIQQIYSQPQFQGGRQQFPQGFSPQGGPGPQFPGQQQFLGQNPQYLGGQQQGSRFPGQSSASQFGDSQQFSPGPQGGPQFLGGFPQGAIPQSFPQQQLGGGGGFGPASQFQGPQGQFSPQAGQSQQLPPQFFQQSQAQGQPQQLPPQFLQGGGQGSQSQGQQQSVLNQQTSPIQSQGFPFDFSPYSSGPGGFPSAIPAGAQQGRFPGGGGGGGQQQFLQGNQLGGFVGGPQNYPGAGLQGGFPGAGQQGGFPGAGGPPPGGRFGGGIPLQGQQIPQQFVQGGFARARPEFGGSSKESDEGAKTS